jgi:hypothetical protein
LLAGSSMPLMARLFSPTAPLHGLADLELVVEPLDFRQAARFWGIGDPGLALLVHAVLGGTPAYRRDFVRDDTPGGPDDFDAWVCRTVLNPGMPVFWEADRLLEEEPELRDRALCHSAIAAITDGHATCGDIAEYLVRPMADVSRALAAVQECGLLQGQADAFRPGRTRFRVTEPLLAFHHAVVRPNQSCLEQEEHTLVWQAARRIFDTRVAAPHFAQVCRDWAAAAAPAVFGGRATAVSYGTLPRPEGGGRLDLEVVVRGESAPRAGALLSVGAASWGEVMDLGHLERLRAALACLAERGEDVSRARPACYSGAGFSPELRAAEVRGEVVLVDPERLYQEP